MISAKQRPVLICVAVVASVALVFSAAAGDLDEDGISKFTDDPMSKYSELGKPQPNVNFIILNAKSKAKVLSKKGEEVANGGGGSLVPNQANINSVVLGAGGRVTGDIIIIDEGKGDKTIIAE